MTTITTRSGKGSPLTNDEMDANLNALNDDKVEASGDSMTGNLSFGDNNKAIFGAGSDLQIYHDGGASYVQDTGTGALYLQGDGGVNIRNAAGTENKAVFASDGAVTLYHNNAVKFATTSTGIDVTGSITTDGLTSVGGFISIGADGAGDDFRFYGDTSGRYMEWVSSVDSLLFRDGAKALFGNGSDLQIYHDGSNSYVKENGTGNLWITSNGTSVGFGNNDLSELYAVFNNDGEAKLFFNGVQKFATSSTGIDVTGTVTADGISSSGDITITESTPSISFVDSDGTNQIGKLRQVADTTILSARNNTAYGNFKFTGEDGSTEKTRLQINGATGDISFYEDTGTTAKLFWDASAESLGIGTSSPTKTLHIVDTSSGNTTTPAMFQNSGGLGSAVELRLAPTPYPNEIGSTARWSAIRAINSDVGNATDLAFLTNDISADPTERMRIDSSGRLLVGLTGASGFGTVETDTLTTTGQCILARTGGNVGIGTTSPSQKLSVAGNIASTGVATPEIELVPTGSVGNADIRFNGTTLDIRSNSASASLLLSTASTERMRIDSGGNAIFTKSNGAYLQLKDASAVRGAINVTTSDGLVFTTGSSFTERMRIDSSGNLLVGKSNTTFSTAGIELRAGNNGARFIRSNAEPIFINRTGSDGKALGIYKAGTEVGSISVTSSATTYNTSSDQRLKDNIVDAPSASDDIDAIQVRSFDWKADGSHQKYGMVAQELQSVAPEAVSGDADSDDMMGVDYSKLVPMLVKEIQSLRARVAQLEGEN